MLLGETRDYSELYRTLAAAAVRGWAIQSREHVLPGQLAEKPLEELDEEELDAILDLGRAWGVKLYRLTALFCAALLHDAGKPACTRLEGGRLVSPRHAAAGARLARRLLWLETGLCGTAEAQSFREMVCELIRWHTKPPHLAERPDAERQLRALGRRRQLALFHAYGASVRIVYLETTWDEQVRRNRDREAAVPEERILHMLDALDPPSPEEARQVQWLCL